MTAAEHLPDARPPQRLLHRAWLVLLPCWLAACAQLEPLMPEAPPAASPGATAPPAPAAASGARGEAAIAVTGSPPAGPASPVEGPSSGPADMPAPADGPASAAVAAAEPVEDVPPRRPLPRIRLDPDQDAERADLWQRLRDGVRIPDLDNDLVRRWEQRYASQPEYMQRMVERGARYLFHIVEEIDKRGMPMDLALLPFIESAFDPQALSRARAAGMWQFMPGTGREFELRQNLFRDDRRDVLASTRAALDFLGKLHERFGDWQLALAAYNWGPGNVARAIERNRRARKPTDLSSLQRLPAETRNYVPKLQAIKNIVARPEAFGLSLPPLENHPYFLSVPIERDIDVALAARLSGLSVETFQQFNPQMNKPVILAAGTPQLLLPYDNANQFEQALKSHTGPLASWTAWVAPRTLKPADAARLAGTSESQLRDANRIPPNMLVKIGSTLLVPRAAHETEDVTAQVADNAALLLAPDSRHLRRVVLRVGKKGDSVAGVARRFRIKAVDVASWNQVTVRHVFRAGSQVVVMLPPKKGAKSPVRTASKTGAKTAKAATKSSTKAAAKATVKTGTRTAKAKTATVASE